MRYNINISYLIRYALLGTGCFKIIKLYHCIPILFLTTIALVVIIAGSFILIAASEGRPSESSHLNKGLDEFNFIENNNPHRLVIIASGYIEPTPALHYT